MTRTKRTATTLGALVGVAALVVLPACSGGDDSDDAASVASLGGSSTDSTAASTDSSTASEEDFQQAMLDYAQCMRDHGIDMPDPEFQEGGGVIQRSGPGEGEPTADDQAEFEAADAECEPILEAARANMPAPSPEEQAEMQEQALAFSQCMRDHGVEDFPDPQFEEDGGVTQMLDRDVASDPDFEDAQTTCQDEIGGPMGGPPPSDSSEATP
jgi:hypothetical protein